LFRIRFMFSILKTFPVCSLFLFCLIELNIYSLFYEIDFGVFVVKNKGEIALYCIMLIIVSNVEKMIGSKNFCVWMIWSGFFLASMRNFLIPKPTGPSFIVFCNFFTLINRKKSTYYFKIKQMRFSETHLLCIFFLQFISYDFGNRIADMLICLISNLIWKALIKIIQICFHD